MKEITDGTIAKALKQQLYDFAGTTTDPEQDPLGEAQGFLDGEADNQFYVRFSNDRIYRIAVLDVTREFTGDLG